MEKLADLPPWAIVVFAITLAFIYAARFFGLASGKNASHSQSSGGATVAAVIVDPQPLNRASKAGEDIAARIQDSNRIMSETSKEFCRRMEGLEESLVDLNRSMKDLSAELARRR